jgi:hypothetical protein
MRYRFLTLNLPLSLTPPLPLLLTLSLILTLFLPLPLPLHHRVRALENPLPFTDFADNAIFISGTFSFIGHLRGSRVRFSRRCQHRWKGAKT